MRTASIIVALACFCFVSGGPVIELPDLEDCDPLFRLPLRHYVARQECHLVLGMTNRHKFFLEKYLKEIGNDLDYNKKETLREMLTELSIARDSPESLSVACPVCTAAVKTLRVLTSWDFSTERLTQVAREICVGLHILQEDVCNGIIGLMGYEVINIVRNSTLAPKAFCSILFNGMCYPEAADTVQWNVSIPSAKPNVTIPTENPGKPRLKVIHLSDTHWDVNYKEGTPSECLSFVCCRENSVATGGDKAGKWGGWMCDLPESTFDDFLEHLKKEHSDSDYIIYTGDIPAHDLWDQSVQNNYNIIDKTMKKIKKALPNTTIYPAVGNHESVPPNLFPTQKQNDTLRWLYRQLNEQWMTWIGNDTDTVLRAGFYSILARPGLRIVSMNMNYCYTMNWWLLLDSVDPEEELKWLVDVLTKAERNGEKVHIIGHIPPGYNDCIKGWQTNFYKIINRFESTVVAQFYGHTHMDEVEIFYDMKQHKRPFAVGYIGPSLTTYTYTNPGYRVYYIDGDYSNSTRFVLDSETWFMDLAKSNSEGMTTWRKLYSPKSSYNMTSLFPKDWDAFYQRLQKDDSLMDLYLKHYWRDSPKRPNCGRDCKEARLCDIRSCVQYGKPNLLDIDLV